MIEDKTIKWGELGKLLNSFDNPTRLMYALEQPGQNGHVMVVLKTIRIALYYAGQLKVNESRTGAGDVLLKFNKVKDGRSS